MPHETPPKIDDLCLQRGFIRPSRRTRIITRTPRMGQYYWVDYPHDAYEPEFFGPHPGIVIRAAKGFGDPCSIVPITSTSQPAGAHVHKLSKNPNPYEPNRPVWAICSHIYTVSLPRLRPVFAPAGAVFPRVDQKDMEAIFACIRAAYPAAFGATVHTTVVSERASVKVEGDAIIVESDRVIVEADDRH